MKNPETNPDRFEDLITKLEERFKKNSHRHPKIEWETVKSRLQQNPDKLESLSQMEETGGEPDVIGVEKNGELLFVDCAAESPSGRRSVAYDKEGQNSRKEHRPENNALDMAKTMGIELLTEEQYRNLQELENFDCKTSSWLKTPREIRTLGGAIFADFRYGQVFIYHNGAQSYYAARGFRGCLKV